MNAPLPIAATEAQPWIVAFGPGPRFWPLVVQTTRMDSGEPADVEAWKGKLLPLMEVTRA